LSVTLFDSEVVTYFKYHSKNSVSIVLSDLKEMFKGLEHEKVFVNSSSVEAMFKKIPIF
jgi:hypothetical protein